MQGRVVFQNEHLDDLIILRSDGTPTYNLAVVVDDHDMGIRISFAGSITSRMPRARPRFTMPWAGMCRCSRTCR